MTGRARLGYGPGMRIRPAIAGALLLLAACGSRQDLAPKSAEQTPPKPVMAAAAPTTEQLLTLPPVARPVRQDDGLTKSEERKDDPFDLPPTR
jgi:multidrug efflux pump subunit AcrA (membrane-fusion protein)